jgi:hypothetical protein
MFCTNLFVVLLLLHTINSVFCWGFASDSGEVLKPQLHFDLNGTAVKPQDVSSPNLKENSSRHISANFTAAGISAPRGSRQNVSGAIKEETTEQVIEDNGQEVFETQHAMCRVTTEELVATAQATVTRVLKGLCNTSKLHFNILLAIHSFVQLVNVNMRTVFSNLHVTPSEIFQFLFFFEIRD